MPEIKTKETEQSIPVDDAVNKEIGAYAAAQEKEADRLFYEAQGLQEDGVTPLDEEPVKEDEKPPAAKEEEKTPAAKAEVIPPAAKADPEQTGLPTEDDLTVSLTVENAKKRIGSAQKHMHESNTRAKTSDAEVTRLQAENKKLRDEADARAIIAPAADVELLEEKPDAQTKDEVEKDLENLRTEYPEIGETMVKMMQKQQSQNAALQLRLDKQDEREELREKTNKENTENAHYNAISEVHPDFAEISQEPLLDDWINGLPAMERAGAQSIRNGGATQDVIEMLTKFKADNGYTAPLPDKANTLAKPNTKIEKAKKMSTPTFNKAKENNLGERQILFTRAQINAWSDKEFAANEEALDDALSKGLVQ